MALRSSSASAAGLSAKRWLNPVGVELAVAGAVVLPDSKSEDATVEVVADVLELEGIDVPASLVVEGDSVDWNAGAATPLVENALLIPP